MNRDPYSGQQLRFDRTCPDFHPRRRKMKLDDLLMYLLGASFFAAIVGGVIIAVVLVLL